MMGGFGSGMGGLGLFGGLISLVLMIGLLGGLVFLGVWLWRRFGDTTGASFGAQSQRTQPPSAREILQSRYARGELTREEYQTMLQDLGWGNV